VARLVSADLPSDTHKLYSPISAGVERAIARGSVLIRGNGSNFSMGSTTKTQRIGIGVIPSAPHMHVFDRTRAVRFFPGQSVQGQQTRINDVLC